jgi:predicted Fe-Mo cluster-binding NifX family protein
MKIVISTDSNFVSAHFGRCPHFTIVDIAEGKVQDKTVIENPGHSPGFLPQFFADKSIECIIAGGMGIRARSAFVQYGIETVLGVTGDIDSVIQRILDGTLEGGESLCDRASGKHDECSHHDE